MMIFLDMDGVLANFNKAAYEEHGQPWNADLPRFWNFYESWGMSEDTFWAKLKGADFWRNVEPLPWAGELINYCRAKAGRENVLFTSAPSFDQECIKGKLLWLEDLMGEPPRPQECVFCTRKNLFAGPGRTLIDDSFVNCRSFRADGGEGILFPAPHNTLWDAHKHDPVAMVIAATSILDGESEHTISPKGNVI